MLKLTAARHVHVHVHNVLHTILVSVNLFLLCWLLFSRECMMHPGFSLPKGDASATRQASVKKKYTSFSDLYGTCKIHVISNLYGTCTIHVISDRSTSQVASKHNHAEARPTCIVKEKSTTLFHFRLWLMKKNFQAGVGWKLKDFIVSCPIAIPNSTRYTLQLESHLSMFLVWHTMLWVPSYLWSYDRRGETF